MEIEKVCVRIPRDRKEELLEIAKEWRQKARRSGDGPGWDAQAIHQIARDKYGSLEQMFMNHGWNERGSDMMRHVQRRVKDTYGSVHAFVEQHREE